MNRYLMLLGVAIIVFSLAGGSLELVDSYNQYQSHLRIVGGVGPTSMSVLDEAEWQFARLVGGGIIMGGLIFGSILMALGWIGRTLEEIRAVITEKTAMPAKAVQSQT
jgi:hypothetical protein